MLELTVDARISNLRLKGSQDIYYQRRYPPSVKCHWAVNYFFESRS